MTSNRVEKTVAQGSLGKTREAKALRVKWRKPTCIVSEECILVKRNHGKSKIKEMSGLRNSFFLICLELRYC